MSGIGEVATLVRTAAELEALSNLGAAATAAAGVAGATTLVRGSDDIQRQFYTALLDGGVRGGPVTKGNNRVVIISSGSGIVGRQMRVAGETLEREPHGQEGLDGGGVTSFDTCHVGDPGCLSLGTLSYLTGFGVLEHEPHGEIPKGQEGLTSTPPTKGDNLSGGGLLARDGGGGIQRSGEWGLTDGNVGRPTAKHNRTALDHEKIDGGGTTSRPTAKNDTRTALAEPTSPTEGDPSVIVTVRTGQEGRFPTEGDPSGQEGISLRSGNGMDGQKGRSGGGL